MTKRVAVAAVLCCAAILCRADPAPVARALLVSGTGGSEMYSRNLLNWTQRLAGVLTNRCGLKPEHVVVLTEKGDANAKPPRLPATAANLQKAMEDLGRQLGSQDQFFLFLAGHGQVNEEWGKLCLPGPDVKATDLGRWIDALPTAKIVIVNAASGGADFLKAYLKPGRVILTATGFETEGTQTYFAEFFIRGLETGGADINGDKAIDMLEAYAYGARETANFYHRQYLVPKPDLGKNVAPAPDVTYWLVRGKETRTVWRKIYEGSGNVLARPLKQGNIGPPGEAPPEVLPDDLDAEPDAMPKFGRFGVPWYNRRMLAEHARLDDGGKPDKAFFLWQPYKFAEPPLDAKSGETGYLAKRTVLGQPK